MDFAALPPEINSGRMYAGAGSGPMWTAASAWDGLAAELSSAAASYRSVVSALTREPWLGPASASMAAAAAPYLAWLSTTAEQAKEAADQARTAATAYEAAFAATVPPPVIAENRALLMWLVATNILGQNTPAIAATETHYADMWAQDATAMYGYAGTSAVASKLTPFAAPPQNTNPTGVNAQAAAVGQAAGTSAGGKTATVLPQLASRVPTVLQGLAAGTTSGPTAADVLNFASGDTFVASGVLFVLGPALEGPVAGAAAATWGSGSLLGASGAATLLAGGPGAAGPGNAEMPMGLGRTRVLAGLGRAAGIGALSVPPSWAGAAPALSRVAAALPESALVSFPGAAADGLGPGYGGMLPGSLMAAAAGGGGAAGGGWAATRNAGAAQHGDEAEQRGRKAQPDAGTQTRYRPPPGVVPEVARVAGTHEPTHGQARWPDAPGGTGPSAEYLSDQINDLRNQVAELAMEREVLMRSLALWARNSPEP